MRILCVIGMVIGGGLIGLSINDKLNQAWTTLTAGT